MTSQKQKTSRKQQVPKGKLSDDNSTRSLASTLKRLLWTSEVKMLLGITIGVFAIVGLFKLYGYWDNYRDRPLADGFTYIGRDYQPGCFLFVCMGSYHNVLFYASDVKPEDAVLHLPGWRLDDGQEQGAMDDYQQQLSNNVLYDRACLDLVKATDQNKKITLCYTKDQETVYTDYRDNKLKPVHKKYLVAVNGDIYREAMKK